MLDDTTIVVSPAGQRIYLNFNVPVGVNYELGISGNNPGIYRNNKYSLCSIKNNQNKSNFRLTVDFAIDLEVVNEIASSFIDNTYNCNDIVEFLENNPEIAMKNLELIKKQKL